MKKNGVIAAGFLLAGALVFGYSQPAAAAVSTWQKGASIQPRWNTDFSSSSFKVSIDSLAADGANYATLVVPVHQNNINSTDVQVGGDTPTDQSILDGINYIHSKGMKAALVVHDNPNDGQWRAFINPNDRATWFANYGAVLNKYAVLGQSAGLNQFILGTELVKMTSPQYSSTNTSSWQAMIQNVRSRFSGTLSYSAQHSGDISDATSLGFWGSLDQIGLSAYFGLGNGTPSVDAIKSSWQRWNNNVIQPLASRYGKPVVFTEVGYQSKDNSLQDPGSAYQMGGGYNATTQNNAYRALFEYWNDYSYMNGVMLWDWSSDPNVGGQGNVDYTPKGKPAEQIMKQWFGSTSTGGGGMGGGGTPTDPSNPPTPPTNPTPPQPPTPPVVPAQPASYTATAKAGTQPTVNTPTTLAVQVSASQAVSNMLVDVEVYNSQGQRVAQKFFENQALSSATTSFSFPWTFTVPGNYVIKVGVFTANWQHTAYWNDAAGNVAVSAATTPSQPPTPPVVTPTQPTQPTTPTPPQTAALEVWWPGSGISVSGVQPFKAALTNTALTQYAMFWQVDGGQLNQMQDISSGNDPHKESMVDLSGWNWNSANRYTITFVAKSLSGAVLATKSVVITVSR